MEKGGRRPEEDASQKEEEGQGPRRAEAHRPGREGPVGPVDGVDFEILDIVVRIAPGREEEHGQGPEEGVPHRFLRRFGFGPMQTDEAEEGAEGRHEGIGQADEAQRRRRSGPPGPALPASHAGKTSS